MFHVTGQQTSQCIHIEDNKSQGENRHIASGQHRKLQLLTYLKRLSYNLHRNVPVKFQVYGQVQCVAILFLPFLQITQHRTSV